MNYWKQKLIVSLIILISISSINSLSAATRNLIIKGNDYSDDAVIISLIAEKSKGKINRHQTNTITNKIKVNSLSIKGKKDLFIFFG